MTEHVPMTNLSATYVVLNRHNLPPVASTRLIRPRLAYVKYYPDILDLRPDVIPLFDGPPGTEVTDYCRREGQGSFPVLLELGSDAVTDMERDLGGTQRLIPAAHITRIHVRSPEELTELRAHEYENASMTDYTIQVSPHLFPEDGLGLDEIVVRLGHLPPAPEDRAERIAAANRMTGGLLAVASHGPDEAGEVEALFRRGLQGERGDVTDLTFIVQALLDGNQDSTDARLLNVVATVLVHLPVSEQPAMDDLLLQYRNLYLQRYPDDVKGLRIIERAEHVMVTQQFRPGNDAAAPVAFALLLHVMRQRLADLTQDNRSLMPFFENGLPGRTTVNIARFLTGLRLGRQRMDTLDRPAPLDAWAAAEEALAVPQRPARLLSLLEPFERKDVDGGGQDIRNHQDIAGFTGAVDGTVAPETVPGDQLPTPDVADVSREKPLPEAVSLEGTPGSERTDLTSLAVPISLLRGWHDLIITTVTTAAPVQVTPERAGRVSLQLTGQVEVTRSVEQADELLRRLDEEPLTPGELAQVRGTSTEPGVPTKAKRTRKAATGTARKRGRKPAVAPEDGETPTHELSLD